MTDSAPTTRPTPGPSEPAKPAPDWRPDDLAPLTAPAKARRSLSKTAVAFVLAGAFGLSTIGLGVSTIVQHENASEARAELVETNKTLDAANSKLDAAATLAQISKHQGDALSSALDAYSARDAYNFYEASGHFQDGIDSLTQVGDLLEEAGYEDLPDLWAEFGQAS